jgi:hypothetical protein
LLFDVPDLGRQRNAGDPVAGVVKIAAPRYIGDVGG